MFNSVIRPTFPKTLDCKIFPNFPKDINKVTHKLTKKSQVNVGEA